MISKLFLLSLALWSAQGSGLDPPTVQLGDLGTLIGKEIKTLGSLDLEPKTYYTFRNIPYAKPITQENRFSVRIEFPGVTLWKFFHLIIMTFECVAYYP